MGDPDEAGISEQAKEFRRLVNAIALGRFKPLPMPTHPAPKREQ